MQTLRYPVLSGSSVKLEITRHDTSVTGVTVNEQNGYNPLYLALAAIIVLLNNLFSKRRMYDR